VSERSLTDRLLAAIPFAVAALALLSLFFWEAAARKTPTVFTDELKWAQLSRAIAATGHAAQRGEPASFKSLYAYFIAPAWWVHSTKTAYSVAKYLDTLAMCLAAVPVYLIGRMLLPARIAALAALAAICTSALYYAGFLIPEPLAYPVFMLAAYTGIRALAGGGRRWIVAAVLFALLAIAVRGELVVTVPILAVAAFIVWITGPRGRRLRQDWSRSDYAGAAVLLVGVIVAANAVVSSGSNAWAVVTQSYQGRMWTLGLNSAGALAIGLGILPMVAGLASLWLPEWRHDPRWRAFAAYTASAVVFFWLYTAVKAAYNSTVFATRIEERNLIYLGPLLIVGTAIYFSSRRPFLPGVLAATAVTTWLVLHYGYQLDYPYFESPGYGVATMANRAWRWDQPTIRIGFAVACGVVLLVMLVPWARRIPGRLRAGVVLLAAAVTVTWMLTGEITSADGTAHASRSYLTGLPQPPDWVDQATNGAGTTFLGQNLSLGQDVGVWLLEFWNRSVKHIWTLDGVSTPGPGPTLTPDLQSADGELRYDPGLDYVVETNGVKLIGTVVASRPNLDVVKLASHPWRLQQASFGISDDGWIAAASTDATSADGGYAYFGPGTAPGLVTVDVGRPGFCNHSPGTTAVVTIGPVALNEQRAPVVDHPVITRRVHVADCSHNYVKARVRPPFAVQIHVSPLTSGTDYGVPDSRMFGVQPGFTFKR
jgi:hypothetical protein